MALAPNSLLPAIPTCHHPSSAERNRSTQQLTWVEVTILAPSCRAQRTLSRLRSLTNLDQTGGKRSLTVAARIGVRARRAHVDAAIAVPYTTQADRRGFHDEVFRIRSGDSS